MWLAAAVCGGGGGGGGGGLRGFGENVRPVMPRLHFFFFGSED